MKHSKRKVKSGAPDNFWLGSQIVSSHPLFHELQYEANIHRDGEIYTKDGLMFVTNEGAVICNPKRIFEPEEWARATAHCLLHLGMEHFQIKERPDLWNIACDYAVEKFLTDLNFGKPFYNGALPQGPADEEKLYRMLCEAQNKAEAISDFKGLGTAGFSAGDMLFGYKSRYKYFSKPPDWSKLFAFGLAKAVQNAVYLAAGREENLDGNREVISGRAYKVKQWFISNYPLIGAVAAHFRIIEKEDLCERLEIACAAVSPSRSEIYLNPKKYFTNEELKFVLAHEFLHAALRHDARQEWRDAFLWNVACDYVINGWLAEMGIGDRPEGVLFDAGLKGMSAEEIYDRIANDMRMYRKLATLRGVGLGDVLPGSYDKTDKTDLDDFYRRALNQGLTYHQEQNRGYLPEGLVEEIRALAHPPIPWDVELARWFEEQFAPVERKRGYARLSRRQSSTPDIPRPNWVITEAALDGRTFGVVLDTSGSMESSLLASALGAVASYSAARDVYAARVVFCDADAYDAGYMRPEDVAWTVKVKGRGGTVLQPGIDLLLETEDFPKDAPILIITDADCDRVVLYNREHAFLIPEGAVLPFVPKGRVFRMK